MSAASLFAAFSAVAQQPASPPKWFEEIAVNGFVSASYSYNFNKPETGTNQLRVFDFDDNSFKLDVATLTIQKAASKAGEAGFRVDLSAGGSLPRIEAAYGLFQGEDFDVKQAFVTYIAPAGNGLRIDAGKFLTHLGFEYIESWDTPNDNATRSFLFGYTVPFTHTGIKASYSFSDQFAAMLMLANGWDNVKDNNSSKSIGAQLTWMPSKTVTVAGNFITGPERTNVNSDPRSVFEAVVIWKLTDSTALGFEGLYGSEKGAVTAGETATWSGLAGYARLGVTEGFALCLRGEYLDDSDGARTGTAQKLTEVTLTPEFKITPHLVFRADLRADFSDQPVFIKSDGSTKKDQVTVLGNVFYSF
jgi:hypothetical protein